MVQAPDGQNRFGDKGGFERFKSSLLGEAPYKGHILLGEVVKWPAYLGEIFNETLVEIGKPNKASDFFELCGWCSIFDSFHFNQVHGNFAGADDQSEIVNMGLLEFALFGSEV
jgi:hypothetical protein